MATFFEKYAPYRGPLTPEQKAQLVAAGEKETLSIYEKTALEAAEAQMSAFLNTQGSVGGGALPEDEDIGCQSVVQPRLGGEKRPVAGEIPPRVQLWPQCVSDVDDAGHAQRGAQHRGYL